MVLGDYKKVLIYFSKLMLFRTFSVLFSSLKICFDFLRVFCEFLWFLWIFEVLSICLDLMACCCLVLDFYVSFLVFWVLLRFILILYKDYFNCSVFLSFSKISPPFFGSLEEVRDLFLQIIAFSLIFSLIFDSLLICFDFVRVFCEF